MEMNRMNEGTNMTEGEYAEHLYKESVHGELCKECLKYGKECDCRKD